MIVLVAAGRVTAALVAAVWVFVYVVVMVTVDISVAVLAVVTVHIAPRLALDVRAVAAQAGLCCYWCARLLLLRCCWCRACLRVLV